MKRALLFTCLIATRVALAAAPEPILRIETGEHTSAVRHVSVDQAGKWLVTSSEDRTARVWDLKTGKLLRTFRVHIGSGTDGTIYTSALSPDGKLVVISALAGSDTLFVIDRASGRLLNALRDLPGAALGLAFSHDGQRLAVTFPRGVLELKTEGWTTLFDDGSYQGPSFSADFDQDNRLVTAAYDGVVRLYDAKGEGLAENTTKDGKFLQTVRFSPDGLRVAVGIADSPRVSVFSSADLQLLFRTDPTGIAGGDFHSIAWSGDRLTGAGTANIIRTWTPKGTRAADDVRLATNDVLLDLAPLPDSTPVTAPPAGKAGKTAKTATATTPAPIAMKGVGKNAPIVSHPVRDAVVYGADDGSWGVIAASGMMTRRAAPVTADFVGMKMRLSKDGTAARFAFGPLGRRLAAFSAKDLTFKRGLDKDVDWSPPLFSGTGIDLQRGGDTPMLLNGKPLPLMRREAVRALAVSSDATFFTLGSDLGVHTYDPNGTPRWDATVPAAVRALNISPDGRFVVVAYGDGTIRWHRASDGATLLTFFPHADQKRWVAYTASGYYATSKGGEALLAFVENGAPDKLPAVVPVSRYEARFHRPDVVSRILDTLDEGKALEQANEARKHPAHARAVAHP
jgi:WD40 repeat protein